MSAGEDKPIRVLVMEDDPGIARLVQKRLGRAGFEITLASNGEEGLALYDPQRFDIITVDQNMPLCDGLETIRRLATCGPLPPIVMVTGTGSEAIAVEAMKIGARDYIVKDVDNGYLELLPAVITQVLEQYRIEQEKRQADELLRRYAAELEHRNRELDAFAHTVAHDLRNPISIILGFSELLLEDEVIRSYPLALESLTMIARKAQHMTNIVEALLLLASVRQEEVYPEPLDMEKVVKEVLAQLTPTIKEAQAEIICATGWPPSSGYAPWIAEVWTNYITNAIKYGGNPPRIELGGETLPDGRARFWVRDNGAGIPPEKLARLFTPFTRLNRQKEGHGLGLSIVRRIMERLNGETFVESEVGKGSTFGFILPGA